MRIISTCSVLALLVGRIASVPVGSGVLALLAVCVNGVPELASYGPVAPDDVVELTSGDKRAAREATLRHPTRFVIAMMAPRVGSKMLCSMLKSYRPGIVYVLMEGNDSKLKAELPNATVAERIDALMRKTEAVARRHTPHHRGRPRAVGFKTAKSLVWDPVSRKYQPTPVYDNSSASELAAMWRKEGVRVICLARLNGLAWEVSRARKSKQVELAGEVRATALRVWTLLSGGEGDPLRRDEVVHGVTTEAVAKFRAELGGKTKQSSTRLAHVLGEPEKLKRALPKLVDHEAWASVLVEAAARGADFTVPLDCSRNNLAHVANETLEHVRQFHGECATLGTRTRALWLPYESIKDGSPRQDRALRSVLDFLNLDSSVSISADTTHDSPGATAKYLLDAARCRAALEPNPYLGAMLDDPYFPYGKAPRPRRASALD